MATIMRGSGHESGSTGVVEAASGGAGSTIDTMETIPLTSESVETCVTRPHIPKTSLLRWSTTIRSNWADSHQESNIVSLEILSC